MPRALRIALLIFMVALVPFGSSAQLDWNPPPRDCGQVTYVPYGGSPRVSSLFYYFPGQLFTLLVFWAAAALAFWPWIGQRRLLGEDRRLARRVQLLTLGLAILLPLVLYLAAAAKYSVGDTFTETLYAASGARPAFACLGPGVVSPPLHGTFAIASYVAFSSAVLSLLYLKFQAWRGVGADGKQRALAAALRAVGAADLVLGVTVLLAIFLNSKLY